MKIGEKHRVRCYDGVMRTGRVIWLHPAGIFALLEFEVTFGKFREAILLDRSTPEDMPAAGRRCGVRFTPWEDAQIMKAENLTLLAQGLGRTPTSVQRRWQYLRRKEAAKCTTPST